MYKIFAVEVDFEKANWPPLGIAKVENNAH